MRLFYKTQGHPFNKDSFIVFVNELMSKLDERGIQRGIFVMDNVPFHRSSDIANVFTQQKHRVFFLPPYSPFLNPIENMFSQWKELVKGSNPCDESHLLRLINEKFLEITETHCRNYYMHMMGYIPRCMNREEIYD
jgi:transposase